LELHEGGGECGEDVGRKAYFFHIKASKSWEKILYFNTSYYILTQAYYGNL
jgi:hypothetical protein